MGVQVFPVLEGYNKHYFLHSESVDWKAIAIVMERLEELSARVGVESLSCFVNSTREDMPFGEEEIEEIEQGSELLDGVYYFQGEVMWSVVPQWFEATRGIEAVQGLLSELCCHQEELPEDEEDWDDESIDLMSAISELEVMLLILLRSQDEGCRFRLCVSG
ncbi:MAG: hypothetical protein B0A82_09460 [Alkalinema sp. CACIAM 70d]|nr:MAG: hypothetical protein B0A82_09460 [Alkalinema sp. CACIAM 70d]